MPRKEQGQQFGMDGIVIGQRADKWNTDRKRWPIMLLLLGHAAAIPGLKLHILFEPNAMRQKKKGGRSRPKLQAFAP
jgi:hypothetical protein